MHHCPRRIRDALGGKKSIMGRTLSIGPEEEGIFMKFTAVPSIMLFLSELPCSLDSKDKPWVVLAMRIVRDGGRSR